MINLIAVILLAFLILFIAAVGIVTQTTSITIPITAALVIIEFYVLYRWYRYMRGT